MTVKNDVERRIADFYASEAPPRAPGRVLDLAIEAVERTPQRRSFLGLSWRVRRLNLYARLVVAALVVIAVGGLVVAITRPGSAPGTVGSPTPPSPAISPSPSPTPGALTESSGPLEAGTYKLGPEFPVPITFEVPDGWDPCSTGPVEQGVCIASAPLGPGVSFSIVENVVADPCGSALMDPPVGPSVDDLVTAITQLPSFQATVPVDVSVDGHEGKQFDLTATGAPGCALQTWATSDRTNGVASGEVNVIQVIDVGGVRVLIAGAYHPSLGPADMRTQIEGVLDSLSIGS
jgi:hypothetical protein